MDGFFQGLLFFIVFGCLIFLAVVATRFIGGRAKMAMKGKYINIIDTVSLGGMDKRLHLIKVGSEFVLISVSMKSVEFITKVNIDDFESIENINDGSEFDFKKYFENYFKLLKLSSKTKKSDKKDISQKGNEREIVENKIHNGKQFRSNLERIRNLTSGMDKIDVLDGDENTNEKK